jgi:hypothetical protein
MYEVWAERNTEESVTGVEFSVLGQKLSFLLACKRAKMHSCIA